MTRAGSPSRTIGTAATAIALSTVAGCGSVHWTFPDSRASDAEFLAAHRSDLTVAVVSDQQPVAASDLAESIEATGLFRSVALVDARSDAHADLIATIPRPYACSAGIPMLTIVTFGVIPTVEHEDCRGLRFTLEPAGTHDERRARRIDLPLTQTIVFGWLGAPLNLLPDWRLEDVRESPEAHRLLGLTLIRSGLLESAGR
jgi:hypothetical protein